MDYRRTVVTAVATTLFSGFSHQASAQDGQRPAIAALVFNYAAVPPDVMRAASEKVAVITFGMPLLAGSSSRRRRLKAFAVACWRAVPGRRSNADRRFAPRI